MLNAASVLLTLLILSRAPKGSALRCWSCGKTTTNDACNQEGEFKDCSPGQACVYRVTSRNDGSNYEVLKGCKTVKKSKCVKDNNQNVNYRSICQYKGDISVCQCCCFTDQCNWPQPECKDVVICQSPGPPGNGKVKCPKSITYGSKCKIRCNKDYVPDGPSTMECTPQGENEGYWTGRSVSCLPASSMTCKKKMRKPDHGSVTCTNVQQELYDNEKTRHNLIGSSCTFQCDKGSYMIGEKSTTCLTGGQWSSPPPICIPKTCPAPVADKKRTDACTDEYNVGSVCTSTCGQGYGEETGAESKCQLLNENDRYGAWSSKFIQCENVDCQPRQYSLRYGNVSCTDENLAGSVCTFTCTDGFLLVGPSFTQCVLRRGALGWSEPAPRCQRVQCDRLEIPQNGVVSCPDGTGVGSKCTFMCQPGYHIVDVANKTHEAECMDVDKYSEKGVWSVKTVQCAPIKCEPARIPENGVVLCSDENNLGSICIYMCDPKFDMYNTTERTQMNQCTESKQYGVGKWSGEPAKCTHRFACKPLAAPAHGAVSCSDGVYLGSECQFTCDDGYGLAGVKTVACSNIKNDGDALMEWTGPAPNCTVDTCPAQWYNSDAISQNCSSEKVGNAYPVGTTCTYECLQPGRYLDSGNDPTASRNNQTTCTQKNTWNQHPPARCVVKTCAALERLQNGNQPNCTDGNNFNSVCNFGCDAKYQLSHADSLVCNRDGENGKASAWDKTPPICVQTECPKVPENPNKGVVTCTSGTSIGSTCTLACGPGYAAKVNRVECAKVPGKIGDVEVGIPRFKMLKDFCCARCNSDFQFVLMVDGRYTAELGKVIDFTKLFMQRLETLENKATFSTFMYNERVHDNSIIRKTVISEEGVTALVAKMEEWEIKIEGQSSDTKGALDFAFDVMFASVDRDAANFLLIAADDDAQNVVETIRELEQKGVNVLVMTDNSKANWQKILENNGKVLNYNADAVMGKVHELAFRKGCSKLASECV